MIIPTLQKNKITIICDLQLYEGVPLSSNSESQTEEQSFEY